MRTSKAFVSLLLVFMFVSGLTVLVTQPTTLAQQTNATVESWPQYRYDQRNTGAINSYGPSLKEPLWVSTLGGSPPTTGGHAGRSAPAVADGMVFVTPRRVIPKAFSVDGDLVWDGAPAGLSLTTPNVDPGLGLAVIADSPAGYVYCANISNGELVWTTFLENDSYTLAAQTIDPVEKKVVVNMFFMLARESEYTVALDLETGAILWKAGPWYDPSVSPSGGSTSTPAIYEGRVYFGAQDGKVYCLSLEDGSEFWSYQTEGSIGGAVTVGTNGLVYAGCHDGYFRVFNSADGTLAWQFATGIYEGDSVYGCALDETRGLAIVPQANGTISALDWNTGNEVWRSKLPDWTGGNYHSGGEPGDTTGATAGQFCPGTSLPTISVLDGKVYIQGVNNTYQGWGHAGIFCFDIDTGTLRDWYIYPGGALEAPRDFGKGMVAPSASIANGRLYVGTYNRNDLYCFGLSTPAATFTWEPASPIINEAVTFNASTSFHPNGTIEAYTWGFGDGATGSGMTITHNYTTQGDYLVVLNVTDSQGLWDTETKSITVETTVTASFTYTPAEPTVDESVTFDASASITEEGTIDSYVWDFGDGSTATGVVANHAYTTAGNYTVWLNVTDSEGLWDTESKSLTVTAPTAESEFPWLWVGVGVVVVIVAAVAIVVLRKRFKSEQTKT